MNAEPMISVVDARKVFAGQVVLDDVSLSVSHGRVVTIIGPSGAGKSTLLRCINHLERLDSGTVRVDGEVIGYALRGGRQPYLQELSERKIAAQRANIGMVFQRFNLFPHMTVLDNLIEAPIRVRGAARAVAVDRARALLVQVGLESKQDAYPATLSGGQQQRVAIARALAMEPKVLLFDEPTSALDPELVGEVLQVIKGLAGSGITMLIVTHEIAFAREVADTIVFMADGRIVESASPDVLLSHPKEARTAEFLATVR